MRTGGELLQRAIALDPRFAPAWLGLVEAHAALGVYGYVPVPECRAAAQEALDAAVRLGAPAAGEAGVISLGTTLRPELERLAEHPTLGPLARRLTWFAVGQGEALRGP